MIGAGPNTKVDEEFRQKIVAECYRNPPFFCQTVLPHWFPGPMPWVHWGALAILTKKVDFLLDCPDLDKIEKNFVYKLVPNAKDSPLGKIFNVVRDENGKPISITMTLKQFTLIIMPRGLAKTTLNNAVMLYLILFQDCVFPVYISETASHAKMQMGNVKRELETNNRIHELFGYKVPGKFDSEKWTEEMITTTDGITVVAKGRGAQVRGLNFNARRPDRIVCDDLEDKESVATEEQRAKTRDWVISDLMPALDRMKPSSSMVMLGTLLHEDALLSRLAKDKRFTTVWFGALDLDGEPLWAANLNNEQLEQEKATFIEAGKLESFYLEYMSTVRNNSARIFKKEFIQYWDGRDEIVAKAIAIDPAISERKDADDCVIAVVGITAGGKIIVLDIWGKRGATPREQIDQYFTMFIAHHPNLCGCEVVAFQAALVHLMKEEMFRRGVYFEIIEIRHTLRKRERILGVLQPRYASRYVYHSQCFPKLEEQLLDFDGKGHDDYPDVVAMATTLLDPFAAQAADPNKDLGDDEYPPIEEVLNGNYHVAP